MMSGAARVFVPAHVTGFFSVHRRSDPLATGSRGAGVTLTDGAMVTVRPSEQFALRVDGEALTIPPVETVATELEATPAIDVELGAPLGAGFGISGAIALGTAFGINRVFETTRTANELVSIAHAAEVTAGTGLGDVVAQHRGGAPIRLEPGAPGIGKLDSIPDRRQIEYVSFGELSTIDVLSGDTDRIDHAGHAALQSLRETPTFEQFMRASREFSQDAGLETEQLRTVIEDVEAAGGLAAMAMLGRTVFAIDGGLSAAGYDPRECEMAASGVTLNP